MPVRGRLDGEEENRMRITAGILCLMLGLAGGTGWDAPNPKAQESESMRPRMEPEPILPPALWDYVRRNVGFRRDTLGVDARFHHNIQNPDHVIPAMLDVFGDVRTVPLLVSRLSDMLISSPENTVRAVHLAYRLLGASAGGFGPPLPGSSPKSEPPNDSESADVLLRKILEIRDDNGEGGRIDGESEKAWRGLPMSVKRLVLAVLQAAVEAKPFLDEAYKGVFDGGASRKQEGDSDSNLIFYERFRKAWAESGEIPDRRIFAALECVDLDGNDREWMHQSGPFRFGFGMDKQVP